MVQLCTYGRQGQALTAVRLHIEVDGPLSFVHHRCLLENLRHRADLGICRGIEGSGWRDIDEILLVEFDGCLDASTIVLGPCDIAAPRCVPRDNSSSSA